VITDGGVLDVVMLRHQLLVSDILKDIRMLVQDMELVRETIFVIVTVVGKVQNVVEDLIQNVLVFHITKRKFVVDTENVNQVEFLILIHILSHKDHLLFMK